METHYCSNCGATCGYDGRCGDGPYLVCACANQENSEWINDGRGGYAVYLNDAHLVTRRINRKTPSSNQSPSPNQSSKTDWSREDD